MAEKLSKAGLGYIEITFFSSKRQILTFSICNRCLSLWTLGESPSALHWRKRRVDWLAWLVGSETNLLVCNSPYRSCGGIVVQRLQIHMFLVRAAAAASLVGPEQVQWNGVWQLLHVRRPILQAVVRVQFPQQRRAEWLRSCC